MVNSTANAETSAIKVEVGSLQESHLGVDEEEEQQQEEGETRRD